MIAVLIGVALLAAITQFVCYCRSALAFAQDVELSEHVLRVAGKRDAALAPTNFEQLFQLVQLCPAQHGDALQIRAVSIYYRLLRATDHACSGWMPAVSAWTQRERRSCSQFAAVVLDRRISSSRDLFLRQAADRP